MLSLLDQNQRPVFVPAGNGAFNAAGILQNVESQQIVGNMQGCPVVTDPNIPTTLNGSQDPIYVMRAEDLWLWETGIRARCFAGNPGRATHGETSSLFVLCFYGWPLPEEHRRDKRFVNAAVHRQLDPRHRRFWVFAPLTWRGLRLASGEAVARRNL